MFISKIYSLLARKTFILFHQVSYPAKCDTAVKMIAQQVLILQVLGKLMVLAYRPDLVHTVTE